MKNDLVLHKIQSAYGTITGQLSAAIIISAFTPLVLLSSGLSDPRHSRFLVATTGMALILSPLIAKGVTRPLRALANAFNTLSEGQLIPQKSLEKAAKRPGQIGHLIRSFLGMAEAIQHRESQLRQQVSELHLEIDGTWQAEVFMKHLLSSDVNWLADVGSIREVEKGQSLTWNQDLLDTIYLILEGVLSICPSEVSSQIMSPDTGIHLSSGDLLGKLSLNPEGDYSETYKAMETTLLWVIPKTVLGVKMAYDAGFASRFKKAEAILLSRKLNRLSEQSYWQAAEPRSIIRDVLFVLGEFYDSDIDWLVAKGERKKVLSGTVLMREGGPIDGLYILLEGSLAMLQPEQGTNRLVHNLLPPPEGQNRETTVRYLYKGEMFGLTPFIDTYQPTKTIKALEDCLVLYIPRQQLMAKLDQDVGFAARFYEVIISMMENQLQTRLSQLGANNHFEPEHYSQNGKSNNQELDFMVLDQMAIAGTRFNWMIGRLSGTEPA
jgi:CRP-like cAMP-binding protein